jgi:hypothetical protein
MTPQDFAPLSYGADQLLSGLAARAGAVAGAHEWIAELLAQHRAVAAEASGELDLGRLEPAVRDCIARGDTGAALSRDEIAAGAGQRAVEDGREVATSADLAFAILKAGRGLVEAPAGGPAPEVTTAPEPPPGPAVPLSFGAEPLGAARLGGAGGRGV